MQRWENLDPVIKMFEPRLAGWNSKFLYKGRILSLIKNTLMNLPIYYLSHLTIPVKVVRRLEAIQCHILWDDEEGRRRFHLVKWKDVKLPWNKVIWV